MVSELHRTSPRSGSERMNCHHTIPAKECPICQGNPFHEELTEEQIAHRKMWKKLTDKERMNWIFANLSDNPEDDAE